MKVWILIIAINNGYSTSEVQTQVPSEEMCWAAAKEAQDRLIGTGLEVRASCTEH